MYDTVPLSDICSLITKGTTPTTAGGGFADSGVNYIKSESLSYDGSIDEKKFAFIDDETHKKLKRSQIMDRDILYSIAGANLGKCGMATSGILPANTNQAVAIIRVDTNRASPEFVSYFLRDSRFVQSVLSGVAQSAQPNVNLAEIGRFQLPVKPLKEQRAIASLLGTLDGKININRQTNETLVAMARVFFKDWFVDFGPTRAKMEGNDPYLAPEIWALFPDRLDDAGIPEGWSNAYISDFCNVKSGKRPPTKMSLPDADNEVPVYGGNGVSWYTNSSLFEPPFIITGRVGTLGTVFRVYEKVWVSDNALCCFPLKREYLEYLFFVISGLDFSSLNSGSTQPLLTQTALSKQTAINAGDEIISAFSKVIQLLFLQVEKNCSENQSLTQTRDLLLPKLMSGEISVINANFTNLTED